MTKTKYMGSKNIDFLRVMQRIISTSPSSHTNNKINRFLLASLIRSFPGAKSMIPGFEAGGQMPSRHPAGGRRFIIHAILTLVVVLAVILVAGRFAPWEITGGNVILRSQRGMTHEFPTPEGGQLIVPDPQPTRARPRRRVPAAQRDPHDRRRDGGRPVQLRVDDAPRPGWSARRGVRPDHRAGPNPTPANELVDGLGRGVNGHGNRVSRRQKQRSRSSPTADDP